MISKEPDDNTMSLLRKYCIFYHFIMNNLVQVLYFTLIYITYIIYLSEWKQKHILKYLNGD